ncbi:hypothetical protein B0H14DRAFT_3649922 [Mycena olivaceomarginata]|nr:hypothetical protein B0H14DRAFT_3649922 [Mycena olivaceomarginata]
MNGVVPIAGLKVGYPALTPLTYVSFSLFQTFLNVDALPFSCISTIADWQPGGNAARDEAVLFIITLARVLSGGSSGAARRAPRLADGRLFVLEFGESGAEWCLWLGGEANDHLCTVSGLFHLASQRHRCHEIIFCPCRPFWERAESTSFYCNTELLEQQTDLSARLFQPVRRINDADIEFYESESDTKAIPAKSTGLRRGTRKRETDKLTESLAAEKADDDGNPFFEGPKKSRARVSRVKAVPESVSDQEDDDFELPDLVDPSDSEGSDDEMDVDNDELVSVLLSKTVPHRGRTKTQTRAATSAGKRKQTSDSASAPAAKKLNRRASVEEVDDEYPVLQLSLKA